MLALLTVLSLALECYIAVVAAVTHTRKKNPSWVELPPLGRRGGCLGHTPAAYQHM